MKNMPPNDPNSATGVSWLILLGLACWGGLVRYLIDIQKDKASWSWLNAFAQIIVSGFTGVLSGLISIESGLSVYWVLFAAGISGSMGSIALTYLWDRFAGVKMQ